MRRASDCLDSRRAIFEPGRCLGALSFSSVARTITTLKARAAERRYAMPLSDVQPVAAYGHGHDRLDGWLIRRRGLNLALACNTHHAPPKSLFAHSGARPRMLTSSGGRHVWRASSDGSTRSRCSRPFAGATRQSPTPGSSLIKSPRTEARARSPVDRGDRRDMARRISSDQGSACQWWPKGHSANEAENRCAPGAYVSFRIDWLRVVDALVCT